MYYGKQPKKKQISLIENKAPSPSLKQFIVILGSQKLTWIIKEHFCYKRLFQGVLGVVRVIQTRSQISLSEKFTIYSFPENISIIKWVPQTDINHKATVKFLKKCFQWVLSVLRLATTKSQIPCQLMNTPAFPWIHSWHSMGLRNWY